MPDGQETATAERLAIVETKVDNIELNVEKIGKKIDTYFKLSDDVVCVTKDVEWMKKIGYFVAAPAFAVVVGLVIDRIWF